MTDSPAYGVVPPQPAVPGKQARKRPRWVKITLLTVGGLVLLLAGVGIGAASNSQTSLVNSQKAEIARLQAAVNTDKSQLSSEQTKLSTAQTNAANALSIAKTQVQAQYKTKFATLQAKEQKVAGLQAKLNRELGIVVKSTITADGVYVVGKDIPAGIYHTTGGNQCYFATLISSTNTSDVNNISDNNNFNGPETVDLTGMYAFQISGGCTWHRE
jgi:hypothetical protein